MKNIYDIFKFKLVLFVKFLNNYEKYQSKKKKYRIALGAVAHAYNPRTLGA